MLMPAILLAVMTSGPTPAPESVAMEMKDWLQAYDAAFAAKDLTRLASFYDPELTIAGGLETLIVSRGGDGLWKIRHSHTSSRRRPAPSPNVAPR
jgi:ketosteroid isomerase-like protein